MANLVFMKREAHHGRQVSRRLRFCTDPVQGGPANARDAALSPSLQCCPGARSVPAPRGAQGNLLEEQLPLSVRKMRRSFSAQASLLQEQTDSVKYRGKNV